MSSCTTLASSSDGDFMQNSIDAMLSSDIQEGERRSSDPNSTTPTAGWSHPDTDVFSFDNNMAGDSVAILDSEGNIVVLGDEEQQRTPSAFRVEDNQQPMSTQRYNNNPSTSGVSIKSESSPMSLLDSARSEYPSGSSSSSADNKDITPTNTKADSLYFDPHQPSEASTSQELGLYGKS